MGKSEVYRVDCEKELRTLVGESMLEYDVLASAISTWHFVNLLALIEAKSLKNVYCIVCPEIQPNGGFNFRLTEEYVINYASKFKKIIFVNFVSEVSFARSVLFLFKRRKKDIIYINPGARPNLKLLFTLSVKPYSFCAIDEGLGTYLPISDFKKGFPFTKQHNLHWDRIKEFVIIILNIFLFRQKERCYLYNKQDDGRLILNQLICKELRKIYSKTIGKANYQQQKTVFILTDYGIIDTKYLLMLFDKLFHELKEIDRIIIKRHPNDTDTSLRVLTEKYDNITLIESKKSAEELVAEYTPIILIGGYTTSLFSCSAIYNIKSLSYMGLCENIPYCSIQGRKEINFFLKCFENNQLVNCPLSTMDFLDELKKMLNGKL